MKLNTIDEASLRRYLLGDLSEDEQASQEEGFLTDQEHFDLLLRIEEDLIDDYVRGRLSQPDMEKVEQRFLSSPGRRERVRLARDLRQYASERRTLAPPEQDLDSLRDQRRSFLPRLDPFRRRRALVLIAASLLAIVGLLSLFAEMAALKGRISSLSQEQAKSNEREVEINRQLVEQQERADNLSQRLEQERNQRIELQRALGDLQPPNSADEKPTAASFLTLLLEPGRTRDSGQVSIIEIPHLARWIRLRLNLEQDRYRSYRAALQTDEGEQMWKRDHLTSRAFDGDRTVEAFLPANLFVPGDYTILLMPTAGRERIGTYYFTVVRKE